MLAERGLNFELESMQGRRHWVDCSTPLLPEVIPEIDANPVSFYWGGERGRSGLELDTPVTSVR